jgi:rubrerythrin
MLFGFNAAEVFDIAINIEENGKTFYTKASQMVDNEDVKALFQQLAKEEDTHKARFTELKKLLPPQAQQPTVPDVSGDLDAYLKMMAREHIFNDASGVEQELKKISSVQDALKLAIQFEKDSVLFFVSMKEATDDTKGREMIDWLIKEEQEHVKRLSLALHRIIKGS